MRDTDQPAHSGGSSSQIDYVQVYVYKVVCEADAGWGHFTVAPPFGTVDDPSMHVSALTDAPPPSYNDLFNS